MLPPFIIEQIRKREDAERLKQRESVLQLPLPEPATRPRRGPSDYGERPDRDAPSDRGVVIIEF